MTQRLKEKTINVNPHQDATVNAMSAIIQEAVGKTLLPVAVKAIAVRLYTKGFRKTIK